MELPKINHEKQSRQVTGEVVYLDEMRRANQFPDDYEQLPNADLVGYESAANLYRVHGTQPEIMDELEKYDNTSEEVATYIALTDELLKLKRPDSPFTFVDIAVEVPASEVQDKLSQLKVGELLASEDQQIAIESNGEYYPVLDITKDKSTLRGVSVRAWGWDDTKVVFTDDEDEQYEFPKHALVYPSNEKTTTRELDVTFVYTANDQNEYWSEGISLHTSSNGNISVASDYIVSAYLETGYEGHGGERLKNVSSSDYMEFASLIAEIVGDEPMSQIDKNNSMKK